MPSFTSEELSCNKHFSSFQIILVPNTLIYINIILTSNKQ